MRGLWYPARNTNGIFLYYHLILTDDCNLCCSYCRAKAFAGGEEGIADDVEVDYDLPSDLSYEPAVLYSFLVKDPSPTVTFYGGEPLLRPDLIRRIMDGAPVQRFMIQTNGILLDRLEPWYLNRFSTILVSVDGREQITDAHRGNGTYRRVMANVRKLVNGGYQGELIARMTVAEDADIEDEVLHLSDNPDHAFTSIHWQLDANFSSDFSTRDFAGWADTRYNPGIRALVRHWVDTMETTGTVPRWYPFLDTMDDLLHGRASRLRCGAGYANYSIMTDGHIAPCPVMVGMKRFYCGHISTADPASLPRIDVCGECRSCGIRDFCGGRCLYAAVMQPWNAQERQLVCGTVRNLHDALTAVLPRVRSLLRSGTIALHDFGCEKYNGCEIIP